METVRPGDSASPSPHPPDAAPVGAPLAGAPLAPLSSAPLAPLSSAPLARRTGATLAAAALVIALLWASSLPTWLSRFADLPDWLGWLHWIARIPEETGLTALYNGLYVTQVIVVVLGAACATLFLTKPWTGTIRHQTPWLDWLLAAAVLGASLWLAWRFPVLDEEAFYRPVEVLILGAILVPLVIEALRRATGMSLFLVVMGFLVYALLGHYLPGTLKAKALGIDDLVSQLGLDTTMMLGRPLVIGVTVVLPFIFFGQLLLRAGGSDFFADFAAALMGRRRGGSAKVAVTASAMFGSISGSAVSNVASTGVVTIPMMRRGGYSPREAGAIEAVASTGGQLTPPVMGAAAFLMAEFLGAPYQDIVLAAIIPAALFYFALYIHVDLLAGRKGIQPLAAGDIPRLMNVLRQGGFLLLPFVVLILVLFGLNETAEAAALAACLVLILVSQFRTYGDHRLGLRQIGQAIKGSGSLGLTIVVITAAAGIVIGLLDKTEAGFGLTLLLVQVGETNLALLLILTAVVCIILGMGMPTTGVYFLVASIATPPLAKLAVPDIAAHMFVFYYGMLSMITPPVAIAAFTAANLAGTGPMATAWTAVRFGWPAYVIPFLFVLSPTLLMKGDFLHVALAVVTALAGVAALTAAIAGFFITVLSPLARVAIGIAGVALVIPHDGFAAAEWVNLAGVALLAAGFAVLLVTARLRPAGS